jgi:hypothetical protein
LKLDYFFKVELNFQSNNRLITLIVFVKKNLKKYVSEKKFSFESSISIEEKKSIFIAIKYLNEMTTWFKRTKLTFL